MDLNRSAEVVALFSRMNMKVRRELPVRASEMGLLIFIVKSESPPGYPEMIQFLRVSKPMIARMLTGLQDKGYILRNQNRTDLRKTDIIATDRGRALVEETYSEYYRTMTLLRDRLGDGDFERLIDLMDRSNRILMEESENG